MSAESRDNMGPRQIKFRTTPSLARLAIFRPVSTEEELSKSPDIIFAGKPQSPMAFQAEQDFQIELSKLSLADISQELVQSERLEDPAKFRRFPELAIEIRLQIWGEAAQFPRILDLNQLLYLVTGDKCRCRGKPLPHIELRRRTCSQPAVLQACRESRKECLPFFEKIFANQYNVDDNWRYCGIDGNSIPFYFNTNADMIHWSIESFKRDWGTNVPSALFSGQNRGATIPGLRFLVMDASLFKTGRPFTQSISSQDGVAYLQEVLRKYNCLEEIVLVVCKGSEGHKWSSEGQCLELLELNKVEQNGEFVTSAIKMLREPCEELERQIYTENVGRKLMRDACSNLSADETSNSAVEEAVDRIMAFQGDPSPFGDHFSRIALDRLLWEILKTRESTKTDKIARMADLEFRVPRFKVMGLVEREPRL